MPTAQVADYIDTSSTVTSTSEAFSQAVPYRPSNDESASSEEDDETDAEDTLASISANEKYFLLHEMKLQYIRILL